MLNFCLFIFMIAAVVAIVGMMVRPTEFFTVYKKR